MRGLIATIGCSALALGVIGCQQDEAGPAKSHATTTLRMEANSDGDLEYCDDDGQCQSLPNPEGCDALVVVIDNETGEACETCQDADGATLGTTCDDTSIACVVVTAPEPDCVVCAHVGGAVIYSSCVAEAPPDCEVYWPEGSAEGCRVCRDAAGSVVLDECPACDDVVCPAVECGPGFRLARLPGECCPVCLPDEPCAEVACDESEPVACPPGTRAVRDPRSCCEVYCEPTECPDLLGPEGDPAFACESDDACPPPQVCEDGLCGGGLEPCPAGFARQWEPPECGACVPVDAARACETERDCEADEVCVFQDYLGDPACGCFTDCDEASGECVTACADCAPMGVCRPEGINCDDTTFWVPPPELCAEGYWEFGGLDPHGCALPPVCVCFDGSIALDGVCRDLCPTDLACPTPACPEGAHLETGYPYCCGICVPDDPCADAPGCEAVDCGPGAVCVTPPDTCEARCVPLEPGCTSDADCRMGEVCSVSLGDCMMPPGCADGMACPAVCTGICVPAPERSCETSADCPPGTQCVGGAEALDCCTADGECDCGGVGICEPVACEPVACTLYCEYGFALGPDGCPICACNEAPLSCALETGEPCPPGFECLPDELCDPEAGESCGGVCVPGAPTCEPVMCELWCEYGFALDERGCPICECREPPPPCGGIAGTQCPEGMVCIDDPRDDCTSETGADCSGYCVPEAPGCEPVLCDLYCELGFALDEAGCPICACQEPPRIPCDLDEQCPEGSSCVPDTNIGCDPAAGVPCPGVCLPEGACDDALFDDAGNCIGPAGNVAPVHCCQACDVPACDLACPFGYALDPATGCARCECVQLSCGPGLACPEELTCVYDEDECDASTDCMGTCQ